MKTVLNVGGNSKEIPIPNYYSEYAHLLLDIDPMGSPDILCDARELGKLNPAQFDAIYCSHNLEHYYRHEVKEVLLGFHHVTKEDGHIEIRVPDMREVMRQAIERDLDIEDTLYISPAGPISVLDVIYGFGKQIESSGQPFFAHKTGFTQQSLANALILAGFSHVYGYAENLEIIMYAFKSEPNDLICTTLGLNVE
ncbi:hypothetical protein KSF73_01545 [Burkholderiaceae bacterium DAT-1]|nr:hypothetical protein [Burkholderiaceae bacterium DAT-1]